jgi:DNA-binding response OmpR family regulator
MTGMIDRIGFTAFPVTSGLACLQMMNRICPRAVVLDVRLDDIDPFALVRADPPLWSGVQIPFVLLAHRSNTEILRRADLFPHVHVIPMPFEPDALIARVRDCLGIIPRHGQTTGCA